MFLSISPSDTAFLPSSNIPLSGYQTIFKFPTVQDGCINALAHAHAHARRGRRLACGFECFWR